MLALLIEHRDDPIGKCFPATSLMRACPPAFDGQHSVEEQYALLRPRLQATSNLIEAIVCIAEFGIDLFEYIDQRRRLGYAGLH